MKAAALKLKEEMLAADPSLERAGNLLDNDYDEDLMFE